MTTSSKRLRDVIVDGFFKIGIQIRERVEDIAGEGAIVRAEFEDGEVRRFAFFLPDGLETIG